MKIAINEIKVNAGRREVSLNGIDELARSISEVGLLNPITIDQDHILIAGLHRLEAAKRLGWTEIECTACGLEGLQAELAEIDENVVRTALSTIEYGELLERRKEIYESLHPETKAGAAQAAGMNRAKGKHVSDKMSVTSKSFAQDTAEKLGVSTRTIERTMQTIKGLTQEQAKFYEQHSSEIEGCQAAKRYFNSLGLKKLPSMQSLKQEYAALQAKKGKLYSAYREAKPEMIDLLTAKNNVERILGVTEKEKNRNRQQEAR